MEKTVPKDTSSMPTSRESEGTAGPKALTNNPIKKNDKNKASEEATRFASRSGVIPLASQLQTEIPIVQASRMLTYVLRS